MTKTNPFTAATPDMEKAMGLLAGVSVEIEAVDCRGADIVRRHVADALQSLQRAQDQAGEL